MAKKNRDQNNFILVEGGRSCVKNEEKEGWWVGE